MTCDFTQRGWNHQASGVVGIKVAMNGDPTNAGGRWDRPYSRYAVALSFHESE